MELFFQFLMFALPGGFVGSLITWFVNSKRRKNDFIADLQKSIDLLSGKYNNTLQELIEVKSQNVKLITNQEEMKAEMCALRNENAELREMLESLGQRVTTKRTAR